MKSIKDVRNVTWKGHEINDTASLSKIRGGLDVNMTTTKDATYRVNEGFDNGQDEKSHESM